MKSALMSLFALVLLVSAAFAAQPNAIVVPSVPGITADTLIPAPPMAPVLTVSTTEAPVPTQAQILAQLQSVSVLVRLHGGSGSGTLVTRQVGDVTKTYCWTAGHCVREEMQKDKTFKNVLVVQEFRSKGKLIGKSEVQAKVIAYSDPERGEDLALLEILQDNFKPLAVSAKFDLSADLQEIGTKLVHVGCTQGLYNSVSYGVISQSDVDLLKDGKMFDQTSTMAYPGSSGGGMYLEDGTYMGMLTRGGGAGLNFVVPMRRILPWAKAMKCEWALDPKVKVAPCKLFDGTESAPADKDPMDQIRACIRGIIGDIIDGNDRSKATVGRNGRPYHTAA